MRRPAAASRAATRDRRSVDARRVRSGSITIDAPDPDALRALERSGQPPPATAISQERRGHRRPAVPLGPRGPCGLVPRMGRGDHQRSPARDDWMELVAGRRCRQCRLRAVSTSVGRRRHRGHCHDAVRPACRTGWRRRGLAHRARRREPGTRSPAAAQAEASRRIEGSKVPGFQGSRVRDQYESCRASVRHEIPFGSITRCTT